MLCRYTQWRQRELARRMRKRPGRMLLGLLLPVLAGFLIAKTGFGSRRTSQAMGDISHTLHLPKIKVSSRIGEDRPAAEDVKDGDIPKLAGAASAEREDKLPPANRKVFGIF